jgi:uncharacterized protein
LTCGAYGPTLNLVLITPFDLQNEPLVFREVIAPGTIDYAVDTRQVSDLPVEGKADLIVEHRGPEETVDDIRVRASYSGDFEVLCARCVEPVAVPLSGEFDLLFRPENADAEGGERAITEDETEIGYYGKTGLLLEDVVREQVLLSLPGRTLCTENCKGLCVHCGQNLNLAPCHCRDTETRPDPRWTGLQDVAVKH